MSFNLAPGVALGEAVDAINKAQAQMGAAADADRLVPGHGAGLPAIRCAPSPT